MMRVVESKDKRIWRVQSSINWSQPATAEEFEHDMAAGHVSGIAMLLVVVALVLFVMFWTPTGVIMPSWVVLLFLLLLTLLPMQWMLRRPWTIVAETPPTADSAGQHWEGTVTGIVSARQDTRQVVESLKARAVPDDGTGMLRQVS